MKTIALLTLIFVTLALHTPGPQDASQEGRENAYGAQKPTLETIAWLSGQWRQETERGMIEELWMPPRGRMMLGLNRTSRESFRTGQFEYMRIVQQKGNIRFIASPSGGESTTFELTAADEKHVVFENPEHDFPKRIEYRLEGKELVAAIAGDGPGPSFRFLRVGDVE